MRGKAAYSGKPVLSMWDHPRLCGEKIRAVKTMAQTAGITPAYAGKSFLLNSVPVTVRDHPRLCGEKSLMCSDDYKERGSPPPMRGKEEFLLYYTKSDGITPAYAGKSNESI